MCLSVTIVAPHGFRTQLEAAAASLPPAALRLEVQRESRWPWAGVRPVQAWISEAGGCACSLLTDDAGWDEPFWSLRPEILEPLACTLEAVAAGGVSEFRVEALWGMEPLEDREVSPGEMSGLARAGQIGTRTRYHVRGSASA